MSIRNDNESTKAGPFSHSAFGPQEDILHRTVADAGRFAFGTVAVDVWVYSDAGSYLYRPDGAWWIDPAFHGGGKEEASDFFPPAPIRPGVDLIGVLWSEATHPRRSLMMESSLLEASRNLSFLATTSLSSTKTTTAVTAPIRKIQWRDVKTLSEDPDQSSFHQLRAMTNSGIRWAAAIPFQKSGSRGIVCYFAREGVDKDRLTSGTNETYLKLASDFIAAAWAIQPCRNEVVALRKKELKASILRAKCNLRAVLTVKKSLKGNMELTLETVKLGMATNVSSAQVMSLQNENEPINNNCLKDTARWGNHKIHSLTQKSYGSNVKGPPLASWNESIWTFAGTFLTLALLQQMNTALTESTEGKYKMSLGPFGALMTLQFGLTAAPASQPRNCILGQLFSLTVALVFVNIDGMSGWLRSCLATSISIGGMMKLGIIHPPAGAAAFIFSGGGYGWSSVISMLLGNLLAIGCATLINNWNEKRQYPTFWGVGFLFDHCKKETKGR
jgi:hypothetical protein